MSTYLPLAGAAGMAACCPPLSRKPLSREQAEQVAPLLKALADPVRLRLMSLIASHPGGEACVCDLTGAFDLSQPTISHHLKVLHEAGLLGRDKRGVWVYYRATATEYASWYRALADPTRIQIVSLLARRAAPLNVGEITAAVAVVQSTVS